MKKYINTIMSKAINIAEKAKAKLNQVAIKWQIFIAQNKAILSDSRGEAYLDLVIKILLCVVLGALLLAGLYALFGNVVMPKLEKAINDMFNFKG